MLYNALYLGSTFFRNLLLASRFSETAILLLASRFLENCDKIKKAGRALTVAMAASVVRAPGHLSLDRNSHAVSPEAGLWA